MNLLNELKKLSDEELLRATEIKVAQERELTNQVLDHLREIQNRRLYAKLGFSSLFQYCTQHLKYCNASAQLRIDAMRLSQELPEIKESLEKGALSLSVIGTFQKFVRQEKTRQKIYSKNEKANFLKQIEMKSKEEAERFFTQISPEFIPSEKSRTLSETQSEIRLVADRELLELIKQMKSKLIQKGNLDPSFADIFKQALKISLKIKDDTTSQPRLTPSQQIAITSPPARTSPGEVKNTNPRDSIQGRQLQLRPTQVRPYIPVSVKNALFQSAKNQCTYVSPLTGKRCTETRALQLDHKKPFAKGGSSEIQNLTVLCTGHNKLRAIESYGQQKMKSYLQL